MPKICKQGRDDIIVKVNLQHECIVLQVVKTTSLSFPVEYAIALIVYSIHVLTMNSIFISQARFYLLQSKVTSSPCTILSNLFTGDVQYMCKISSHCSNRSCTCTKHLSS